MNNHHRMSKRKRQAVLFFTYGFMTLAVIVISVICLLLIMGYRFNISDRTIEQGGLLQFRSTPSSARVTINDVLMSASTPTKRDVPAGTHQVKFSLEGYHDWQRSVSIKAGELRWLNYARFVPTTITNTTAVTLSEGAVDALPTPDRRFVAVVPDAAAAVVQIIDLRNPDSLQRASVALPAEQITTIEGQQSQFAVYEWDFGSRFLLLTHRTGDTTEFIRVDRTAEDGDVRNITKEFNLPFRDMHFSGTSGNVLYAITNNDVRRIDTSAGSVTQPLISNVETYRLYRENDIAYVALRQDTRIAGVYIDDKETIVRSVPADQQIRVDVSRYFSHYYLAIAGSEGVDIIKDPAEPSTGTPTPHATLVRGEHASNWLDFGSSGRFVINGDENAYSIYDLETDESFTVRQPVVVNKQSLPMWLDDYYLVSVKDATSSIFDYDGANVQSISAALPGLPVFLSPEGTFIYSFVEKNGVRSLQASRMILEN